MGDIVLLDTTVYLNILDVPGRNQDREDIFSEFGLRIENGDNFLLPMASIWETGNHIAHLADGNLRRQFTAKLVSDVRDALNGKSPYQPTYFPTRDVFMEWLDEFPDYAQRNKSDQKPNEGISLSDLSIIKEWTQTSGRHFMSRVLIWSLDCDLSNYDTGVR
ncbi:MAG: hypothetical protein LWW75_00135 [Chlorobiales bacterium]|nr:hypothetical protein [Chlorobiales bacterium]